MLTDTHAHLDFPDFADELDAVIQRAEEAGVTRIITIGTTIEGSERAVALAEKYPQVYAVVGVHPTSAMEAPGDILTPLRELAKHPRVVAIGETGLDYHRLPSNHPGDFAEPDSLSAKVRSDAIAATRDDAVKYTQALVFQQQLELAAELGLNVVIHQRDAWADTLEQLKPHTGKLRAVFHCFGGSLAQAQEVFGMGHMVSFTGIVTFKNAETVQQCAAKIPDDRFMIETDCPYLAPAPLRGKRCEPAHVRHTAEFIAGLRRQSVEVLARTTTQNAHGFFAF